MVRTVDERGRTASSEVAEYHRPLLVDAKKIAAILDLSDVTVYRMAKAKTLPSIRIGASVRFSVAAIERWVAERESAA